MHADSKAISTSTALHRKGIIAYWSEKHLIQADSVTNMAGNIIELHPLASLTGSCLNPIREGLLTSHMALFHSYKEPC